MHYDYLLKNYNILTKIFTKSSGFLSLIFDSAKINFNSTKTNNVEIKDFFSIILEKIHDILQGESPSLLLLILNEFLVYNQKVKKYFILNNNLLTINNK